MRRLPKYIHLRSSWPEFTWRNGELTELLASVRHRQGRLLGKLEGLAAELRAETRIAILTADVVKSSAIEGEKLDPEAVRSSIARRLGAKSVRRTRSEREVEGIVEMTIEATRRFDEPLSKERLVGWHAALFPTGRSGGEKITVGEWRLGPMTVVSGVLGREKVHFEAPAADRVTQEMSRFVAWFNGPASIDPVLKAAIAHLWFVTIHPFDDGNGRIARAITDAALARADGSRNRFYSMSSQIELERKVYYQKLEDAQRGTLDITSWLEWFLACLGRAIDTAGRSQARLERRAALMQQIQTNPMNDRQRSVLQRMLENFEGFLTTSKYAKLARCSADTALRDIQDLVSRGVLAQNDARGRSTSYRLDES